MSKKSKPGDGTNNCGVKGGGLYGAHLMVQRPEPRPSFLGSFLRLTRVLRQDAVR